VPGGSDVEFVFKRIEAGSGLVFTDVDGVITIGREP
jgi:hypothetical protein